MYIYNIAYFWLFSVLAISFTFIYEKVYCHFSFVHLKDETQVMVTKIDHHLHT